MWLLRSTTTTTTTTAATDTTSNTIIIKNNDDSDSNNTTTGGGGGTSQQAHKSHPEAYHTSRILDDEIAKSKSLKLYTSNDSSLNTLDFSSFL